MSVEQVAPPAPPRGDTGLAALELIGRHHSISVEPAQLRHELGLGGRRAAARDLVRGARLRGMRARAFSGQRSARLLAAPAPMIIGLAAGGFAVLRRPHGRLALVNPLTREVTDVTEAELLAAWSGEFILLRREPVTEDGAAFGLGWFATALFRYRGAITHILVCSLFVQVFALASPLLFQVIIDKALVHKSTSTLAVIAVAMISIGVFDASLQYLRTYALSYTSSRVDVELGAKLFGRLLDLPLGYFESRAAGQTVARVRELENVRNFLTGQGLSSFIDAGFTLVFLAVLFFYSATLAQIVLCSIPLYLLVIFGIRPLLRERSRQRFNCGAESQQFLVESVVGVATIKAAAVEPLMQRQWEERLAAYVRSAFRAGMLASLGQNAITLISRVTTALVLVVGSLQVMAGKMTVGELVAFNMIAGQLQSPVLRLAGLWQDFQQVQVSIERIGDVYNAKPEPRAAGPGPQKQIEGEVRFEGVSFGYRPDAPPALDGVNLHVPAGQVVGIVGASGSGKSTLAKLIQRLYLPQSGKVLVDGIDVSQVNPAWLRRQIGVVLQENLLFNRTIHENIAFATPAMPRREVMEIADLAGADEFIRDLPQGYDTPVQERGANLSGGQRQRIAIARALARNPRILIFDEATSALDYESERIIRENMRKISRQRTVLIIAHRLAAVRDCDRIIGLDRGRVVEDGAHEKLLQRPDGLYARLWAIQNDIGAIA